MRSPPSLDEVHADLRQIIALTTTRICCIAGATAANSFAGIRWTDSLPPTRSGFGTEYLTATEVAELDLERFEITGQLAQFYNNVRSGVFEDQITSCAVSDFLACIPESDINGEVPAYLREDAPLLRLIHYGLAYSTIASLVTGEFLADSYLSVSEVASLAGMSARSVRNAMAGKSAEIPFRKDRDRSVHLPVLETLRWLAGRRGFVRVPLSTRMFLTEGPHGPHMLDGREVLDRAQNLRRFAAAFYWNIGTPLAGAKQLRWDISEVEACFNGVFPEAEEKLNALASLLHADPQTFTATVNRYRDILREEGEQQ